MTATVDNAVADLRRANAELQRRLDERTAERDEVLDQQIATAEVLQVINASPGDLAPVFEAMLEKATTLCDAASGVLWVSEGERFRSVASRGLPEAFEKFLRTPVDAGPDTGIGRLRRGAALTRIADMADAAGYRSGDALHRAAVDLGGIRSLLAVPLQKDGVLFGAFGITRLEVRPFTDKQIALLQNFAAQAVIAMENARLLGDLRERTGDLQESLEYQTATSDVLKVISRSTFDLQPVLDTLLQTASRLCNDAEGALAILQGSVFRYVATVALTPEFDAALRERSLVPGRGSTLGRVALEGRVIHIADIAADPEYALPEVLTLGKIRTTLGVPLVRQGETIGVITLAHRRVEPFSDKQIALVSTFADQAVIAIENTRLINETREALEQQTATAEVLQVINSSPGDLAPVFDAMLERAIRLCDAVIGTLWIYDSEQFRLAAVAGGPQNLADILARSSYRYDRMSEHVRALRDEYVTHVLDARTSEAYLSGDPVRRAMVDIGGGRTLVTLSLQKDDEVLGIFTLYRQDVRPFTDKQIALLQSFAAQAVIAIENARLITETQEALEKQTATAEILRVISSSATDVQPVFNAIVERATKLCDAEFAGVARYHDGQLHLIATNNLSSDEAAAFHSLFPRQPNRGFVMGRAFLERRPVLVEDILVDPDYDQQTQHDLITVTRYRTFLGVPIMQDGRAIGVIGCARREIRPFTAGQIELVSTFADQAVIAIKNARLLGEIQQRQAELRVTFDNMADGVAMFDEAMQLAAWNRNFQELLQLPDQFFAEPPGFDDYIRYLTERGEFGETDPETQIKRLRERLGDHYTFERTRPDGKVIEVRNNPMPDGGIVVIYSDITERKRSEEEIRAARDAAEATLRDLRAAQANLIQAEKMASLGQLTAGIAHEIKNPLNFVNNFASLSVELLDELKEATEPAVAALDDDKRAEVDETMVMLTGNLEKIAEHGKRADNIVKSMLEHSRGVSGERREVDLNGVIEEALNLAYHGARAQDTSFNITLERDYAAGLTPIVLAPQEMTRVFLNLFGNGFYAANKRARANGDGSFRPVLSVTTREDDDAVEVRVRDNGTGIPPEIKDKLFQPFFTTKPTGQGTGLGLSISYDIVTQQHGGTITVESEPGAYTELTVRLPRH